MIELGIFLGGWIAGFSCGVAFAGWVEGRLRRRSKYQLRVLVDHVRPAVLQTTVTPGSQNTAPGAPSCTTLHPAEVGFQEGKTTSPRNDAMTRDHRV